MRSVMLRIVSIWARRLGREAARLQQQQVRVSQHRRKRVVQAVAHLEHVASKSRLALQHGAGKLGSACAGFGSRTVYRLARPPEPAFQASARWAAEWKCEASAHAPAAPWQHPGIHRKSAAPWSAAAQGQPKAGRAATAPTMATSNTSTAKRGHRSPLRSVNVGTLRSICQRAVMRREKSASSEMISTVGVSTGELSFP